MFVVRQFRVALVAAGLAAAVGVIAVAPVSGRGMRERDSSAEAAESAVRPEGLPAHGAAAAFPVTVTDDAGFDVTVSERPQRIISLTSFTDDILLDLVDRDRLLGVTAYSGDPAISNVTDKVGDVPYKLLVNVEVILSLQPDIVFVANWTDAADVTQLRACGVRVFLLDTALTVEAIRGTILTLARLVGEPERGAAMVSRMNERLAEVANRVSKIPAGRRLSVLDYTVWGSAQGRGSTWDEVVRRAGLVNAVGKLAADEWGQVTLSREKLLEIDPDVVVLPGWVYGNPEGAGSFYRAFTTDPAFQHLRAVREGRVYQMPEGLREAASQYIADAVEYLARLAYPQLWDD